VRHVPYCIAAAATLLAIAVPQQVAADPIAIRSGTIRVIAVPVADAVFNLEGDTFSLAGSLKGGLPLVCSPCLAGTHLIGMRWGGDIGSGSGTFDGTSHPELFFSGTGFGVEGIVTLPPEGPLALSLAFPFSVAPGSTIRGYSDPGLTNRLFEQEFMGAGTASMSIGRLPGDPVLYSVTSLLFTFDAGVSPVPEPGSLLLLGSGLVGIAARARRRWRRW
jgi:hypothetical protein